MLKYLIGYLGAGLAFAALDAAWLTLAGPKVYRPALDPVLADRLNAAPAAAFYLIYVFGILMLAVAPAARDGLWSRAVAQGAILGVTAYAAYDLTNQATLKVWALRITLLDIGWGAFATALASAAGFFAFRWAARKWG